MTAPAIHLKPWLSHAEMSFGGRFLLWRGGSDVPLKLPSGLGRVSYLGHWSSYHICMHNHLGLPESLLGPVGGCAGTGSSCKVRGQVWEILLLLTLHVTDILQGKMI